MNQKDNFTITKKIAKHGSQAIIVIPRILEKRLRPGTVVRIEIDVLQESSNEKVEEIKLVVGDKK